MGVEVLHWKGDNQKWVCQASESLDVEIFLDDGQCYREKLNQTLYF